jgi:hypothetical protein
MSDLGLVGRSMRPFLLERPMTHPDLFHDLRNGGESFRAETLSDGRSLRLTATDLSAFHPTALDVIATAHANRWHVVAIDRSHPGANILSLAVSPRR